MLVLCDESMQKKLQYVCYNEYHTVPLSRKRLLLITSCYRNHQLLTWSAVGLASASFWRHTSMKEQNSGEKWLLEGDGDGSSNIYIHNYKCDQTGTSTELKVSITRVKHTFKHMCFETMCAPCISKVDVNKSKSFRSRVLNISQLSEWTKEFYWFLSFQKQCLIKEGE